MSREHRSAFAQRLAAYVSDQKLERCLVVLHGGEPLLAGSDLIVDFVREVRSAVGTASKIEFGLQTNGLLLTDSVLDAFEAERVSVSLSLDGPRQANDRHRVSRRSRRSSFDKAFAALERLLARPAVFAGLIAVIDPATAPVQLFEFFDRYRPPRLDFLLPDANHMAPPPGRDASPDIYLDWLIDAFDLWFDRFPHLRVRLFESLLDAVAGLPAATDAFGLGDVSLLTIETDGTYHDLDVLKVTSDGATRLFGSVADTTIATVATAEKVHAHRRLLSKDGLCETCRTCPHVDVCGGGSVPHRFDSGGFDHPTVYCREMKALIEHARRRLMETLSDSALPNQIPDITVDLQAFEVAEQARPVIERLWELSAADNDRDFQAALDLVDRRFPDRRDTVRLLREVNCSAGRTVSDEPGAIAWQSAIARIGMGGAVYAVDGTPIDADPGYVEDLLRRPQSTACSGLALGEEDRWLRLPFGNSIAFEPSEVAREARDVVQESLRIIAEWRPALAQELRTICRAVQFVRDPSAHPDKIVSFSDNSVPGALYVSVRQGSRWIDAYDLADSLIHEHRHQKLYMLERIAPLFEPTTMKVVSPWREDLRPPSGLMHAVFVFVELRRFWLHVLDHGPARLHNRAVNQVAETDERLDRGMETLRHCPVTQAGRELLAVLDRARCSGQLILA